MQSFNQKNYREHFLNKKSEGKMMFISCLGGLRVSPRQKEFHLHKVNYVLKMFTFNIHLFLWLIIHVINEDVGVQSSAS